MSMDISKDNTVIASLFMDISMFNIFWSLRTHRYILCMTYVLYILARQNGYARAQPIQFILFMVDFLSKNCGLLKKILHCTLLWIVARVPERGAGRPVERAGGAGQAGQEHTNPPQRQGTDIFDRKTGHYLMPFLLGCSPPPSLPPLFAESYEAISKRTLYILDNNNFL